MELRWMTSDDVSLLERASELFDEPVRPEWAGRFLGQPNHHLCLALDGGEAVGFVSAVEQTHPDKGTEMFLYELGVDEAARGRGIGTALVRALAELARARGCYGMWVLTDADNAAALATYRAGGAGAESAQVMLSWDFPGGSGGSGTSG